MTRTEWNPYVTVELEDGRTTNRTNGSQGAQAYAMQAITPANSMHGKADEGGDEGGDGGVYRESRFDPRAIPLLPSTTSCGSQESIPQAGVS